MFWTTRRFNPWQEFNDLQNEMNNIFATLSSGFEVQDFPPVNIQYNEHEALLSAEIPGIDVKDLEITVKNDLVTIRGQRDTDMGENKGEYLKRERGAGKFTRSFSLPFPIDSDKVTANYKLGILHVTLPRAEADKPKKITIGSK